MGEKKSDEQKQAKPPDQEKSKAIEPKVAERSDVLAPYSFRDMEREFERMMERFERDFSDLMKMPRWLERSTMRPLEKIRRLPAVDLEDKGVEYVLTADMPGFSKDDIEINLTDDSIELQAVRRQSREEQDKERKYIRRERASEIYYRQIGLPEQIRSNEAKATLKDGILQVILPKKAPKRKTKLEII